MCNKLLAVHKKIGHMWNRLSFSPRTHGHCPQEIQISDRKFPWILMCFIHFNSQNAWTKMSINVQVMPWMGTNGLRVGTFLMGTNRQTFFHRALTKIITHRNTNTQAEWQKLLQEEEKNQGGPGPSGRTPYMILCVCLLFFVSALWKKVCPLVPIRNGPTLSM